MKVKIQDFMKELRAAYKRGDGYIMGTKGQDPKKLNAWYFNQYNPNHESAGSSASSKTYAKALEWKNKASRVWDCNGLSEGIYEDITGVNINSKARYNYAEWCDPKGTGMIPAEKRVEGAAVFWGEKASKISHVAYLDEPVEPNKPEGDWWIIEARGVMYGVVRTKLYSRDPNFWGWMTKYYEYDETAVIEPDEKVIKRGDKSEEVKEIQTLLKNLGYDLEIDGDFGSITEKSVKDFQKNNKLTANGIVDEETYEKLKIAEPAKGDYVVTGGSVYLWEGHPSYGGKKTVIVRKNAVLDKPEYGDYEPVVYDGALKWINKKYIKESK